MNEPATSTEVAVVAKSNTEAPRDLLWMPPRNEDAGVASWFRDNPAAFGQDIFAWRSESSAQGFYYVANRAFYDLLDEMPAKNITIRQVRKILWALVMGAEHRFVIDGDQDDVKKKVLDECRKALMNVSGPFGWMDLMRATSVAPFDHGFSTVETEWEFRDGLHCPKNYYHLHPGHVWFRRDGALLAGPGFPSIMQGQEFKGPDRDRFIVTRVPGNYADPYGESELYGVRALYELMRFAIRGWASYVDNHDTPLIVVTIDPEMKDRAFWQAAVENAIETVHQRCGITIPKGIEWDSVARTAGGTEAPHMALVRWCDTQFRKLFLGGSLASGESEGGEGSYAQAQVHETVMGLMAGPIGRYMTQAITRDLVRPFLRFNYGSAAADWIRFEIGWPNKETIDSTVKRLMTAKDLGIKQSEAQQRELLGGIEPPRNDDDVAIAPSYPQIRALEVAAQAGVQVSAEQQRELFGELKAPTGPADVAVPLAAIGGGDPGAPGGPSMSQAATGDGATIIAAIVKDTDARLPGDVHKFSSVQFDLSARETADINLLSSQIQPADLAGDGREDSSHLTVKYGLHTRDAAAMVKFLRTIAPFSIKFGKPAIFPATDSSDGCDVLIVEIESHELVQLNELISKSWDHTTNFANYMPHITIAYLKPGAGAKYLGGDPFEGRVVPVERLTFSSRDGVVATTPLQGTPSPKSRLDMKSATTATDYVDSVAAEIEERIKKISFELGKANADQIRKSIREALAKLAKLDPNSKLSIKDLTRAALDVDELSAEVDNAAAALRLTGLDQVYDTLMKASPELIGTFTEHAVSDAYDGALKWMETREIATPVALKRMVKAASILEPNLTPKEIERLIRRDTLTLAQAPTVEAAKKWQDTIARSIKAGDTVAKFSESIRETLEADSLPAGLDAYLETVYRTESSAAMTRSAMDQIEDPALKDAVWGIEIRNAELPTSRPSHKALNGLRLKKDSEAYNKLREDGWTPFDYNCTCVIYPVMNLGDSSEVEPSNALELVRAIKRFND